MKLLLLLIMLSPLCSFAVVETYQFDNDVLRERYQQFVEELRCPKCQNQNLAGSNSPIAKDLRRELHRLLQQGQSDQQVVDYMVARYGEFILYRPRFNAETALLWLAPALFLLLGLVIVLSVYKRQQRAAASDGTVINGNGMGLDETEQQQLQRLLTVDVVAPTVKSDTKEQTNA